jgi:hypothetical protein
MTARQYSQKYDGYPTFQKIALDAFEAGRKSSPDGRRLQSILKRNSNLRREIAELKSIMNDPDKFCDWVAGG